MGCPIQEKKKGENKEVYEGFLKPKGICKYGKP